VMGHPMVEIGYDLRIFYPEEQDGTDVIDFATSYQPTLTGIGNGVLHLKVPMPSVTLADYLPIIDNLNGNITTLTALVKACSSSAVIARFRVVSTMLDVDPTIRVAVFMSAESDFRFCQPNAVGLANPGDNESLRRERLRQKRKVVSEMTQQVNLPPVNETFETRSKLQGDGRTVPALEEIEDLFKIWARAIPFSALDEDTDEPIPSYEVGVNPCWYEADSAAWTPNVNNSWYFTQDYLSLFSAQFLFYRGAIGHKIVCQDNNAEFGYKYVSLGVPFPDYRQQCHVPFTYPANGIPDDCNLGYGVVITPLLKQPVLDVTIPFRSCMVWRPVFWDYSVTGSSADALSWGAVNKTSLYHNIVLWDEDEGDLDDALFRKGGDDYVIAVEGLIPPPYLWVARGFHWTDTTSLAFSTTPTKKLPTAPVVRVRQ